MELSGGGTLIFSVNSAPQNEHIGGEKMAKYVLIVDVSGSMRCKLKNLKEMLADDWVPWRIGSPANNEVALISFCNDVCINSYYSNDVKDLQNRVMNLSLNSCGGSGTALYDAIIVGLTFESPKPDAIYVWSDLQDNDSHASEMDYINLANSIGITINLCPAYEWMQDPHCPYITPLVNYPFKPIQFSTSVAIAKRFASKLNNSRVIENPTQLIQA